MAAETSLLLPAQMGPEHSGEAMTGPAAEAERAYLAAHLAQQREEEGKLVRAAARAEAEAQEAQEAHGGALAAYDQAEEGAGRAIAELRAVLTARERTARVLAKRARKAARADARATRAQRQSERRTAALEAAAKEQGAGEVQHWSLEQLLVPPSPSGPRARLTHLVATLQARVDALPEPAPGRLAAAQQENEDLLVLLEDLTIKRKGSKAVLRSHGHVVSDDDDEADEAF